MKLGKWIHVSYWKNDIRQFWLYLSQAEVMRLDPMLEQMKRNIGKWMISWQSFGGYAYAKVCSNGSFLIFFLEFKPILAMNPTELGECYWDEWDCPNGNLLQNDCSFVRSTGKWTTTAKTYQIPHYLQSWFQHILLIQ